MRKALTLGLSLALVVFGCAKDTNTDEIPTTVDPCAAVSCGTNGNCVAGACECSDGYTGEQCEIGPCANVNCGDHGVCVAGACDCSDGYTGEECETGPCANVDCGDHGVCVAGACECNDGFSGDLCDVDPCAGIDCGAHGTCLAGACVCSDGFSGNLCDVEDACTGIECGINGSCSGGLCVCDNGFIGNACHINTTPSDLELVGQLPVMVYELTADVWGYGSYVYMGSYVGEEETNNYCNNDLVGVRIIDISDVTSPQEVAFLPANFGARNVDVKVDHIETAYFQGEILVVGNEPCDDWADAVGGQTGLTIYDATDPTHLSVLSELTEDADELDFMATAVHNIFIYQQGEHAYLATTGDQSEDVQDFHIIDITDPTSPSEVSLVGLPDWTGLVSNLEYGESLLHDLWIQENGGVVTAYLAYWDVGLVLLDITDPAAPVLLGNSDYQNPDPITGMTAEGEGHVVVPTADGSMVLVGDEDFYPYDLEMVFDGVWIPTSTDDELMKPFHELMGSRLKGPVQWVGGGGCDWWTIPDPISDKHIALMDDDYCWYEDMAENAEDAGYAGFIVIDNWDDGGEKHLLTSSEVEYDIAGIFVPQEFGDDMIAASPDGTVQIDSTFNGWGYVRLMDVSDPANIVELGQFTLDETFASGPTEGDGIYTAHNIMVHGDRAVFSWYSAGIQLFDFSMCEPGGGENSCTPVRTGCFEASDGEELPSFWGVHLLENHPDGEIYILGSDMHSGLYILRWPGD